MPWSAGLTERVVAVSTDRATVRGMPAARREFHLFLIFACVAVYVLQQGDSDAVSRFGVSRDLVFDGEIHRLLTAGFLHLDAVHLAMNMLSLYFLGRLIEPALSARGRFAFPLLYVGSLLGGSVGAMILEPAALAVGASGAIYGLLGAAVGIPLRRGLGWNSAGVAPWIAFNLAYSVVVPGISLGGHLGGLVTGAAIGWLLGS
jgi:membrane associated rhomboid family serine protease